MYISHGSRACVGIICPVRPRDVDYASKPRMTRRTAPGETPDDDDDEPPRATDLLPPRAGRAISTRSRPVTRPIPPSTVPQPSTSARSPVPVQQLAHTPQRPPQWLAVPPPSPRLCWSSSKWLPRSSCPKVSLGRTRFTCLRARLGSRGFAANIGLRGSTSNRSCCLNTRFDVGTVIFSFVLSMVFFKNASNSGGVEHPEHAPLRVRRWPLTVRSSHTVISVIIATYAVLKFRFLWSHAIVCEQKNNSKHHNKCVFFFLCLQWLGLHRTNNNREGFFSPSSSIGINSLLSFRSYDNPSATISMHPFFSISL